MLWCYVENKSKKLLKYNLIYGKIIQYVWIYRYKDTDKHMHTYEHVNANLIYKGYAPNG